MRCKLATIVALWRAKQWCAGLGSWIASPGPWRVTLYLAHPSLPDLQSG